MPTPWRRSTDEGADEPPLDLQHTRNSIESAHSPANFGRISPKKRKIPVIGGSSLDQVSYPLTEHDTAHARNRSISEYIPEGLQAPKIRNIAVSSSGAPVASQQSPPDEQLHREQCLAVQRGLVPASLPSPPASSGGSNSDELQRPLSPKIAGKDKGIEYETTSIRTGKMERWRGIRQLGEGQFSKVMLAMREDGLEHSAVDPNDLEGTLDPQSLVAVKICNHGPAGGADEKSLQTSIKRELDLMKAIDHPSLVHLKAVNMHDRETLFVLNYCPGGDLFELASTHLDLLKPPLIRRIFSELVGAVQYLHAKYIVHRDVKLESKCCVALPFEAKKATDVT